MAIAHSYSVNLAWQHDRKGVLFGEELNHSLDVATPPPFPKGMEGVWSPEHLFTAAVSSCLMTTFLAIAENSKLEFESFTCKASSQLDQVDGKYQMTEVLLEPMLVLKEEKDRARALRILEKAETACLITNSVKAKVTMKPVVSADSLTSVTTHAH